MATKLLWVNMASMASTGKSESFQNLSKLALFPHNFIEDDIEYPFGLSQTYISRRLRSHEVEKLVSRSRCVEEW